jgi:hypothetical protein
MRIAGGCHCGLITFEAEADPEQTTICHCTDCQQLTGTAFRTTVTVEEKDFRMTGGEPTTYVKIGDSGVPRLQAFCPRCGSPIFSAPAGDGPKSCNIRVGVIRQRDRFVPRLQIWSRSKQRWLGEISSIRSLDTQ